MSTRLLETLESIMFAEESYLVYDTNKTITSECERYFSNDLAILQRWMDIVCARVMEDYAKVNKTLFVEA